MPSVVRLHDVERVRRGHAEEAGGACPASRKDFDVRIEVEIGEAVGVVGEEHLVAIEVRAAPRRRRSPMLVVSPVSTNVIRQSSMSRLQQVDLAPALGQDEVVRHALVVLEEELLDLVAAVAEAQDEVLVPEVGVVLHQVPQDRPRCRPRRGASGSGRSSSRRRMPMPPQNRTTFMHSPLACPAGGAGGRRRRDAGRPDLLQNSTCARGRFSHAPGSISLVRSAEGT